MAKVIAKSVKAKAKAVKSTKAPIKKIAIKASKKQDKKVVKKAKPIPVKKIVKAPVKKVVAKKPVKALIKKSIAKKVVKAPIKKVVKKIVKVPVKKIIKKSIAKKVAKAPIKKVAKKTIITLVKKTIIKKVAKAPVKKVIAKKTTKVPVKKNVAKASNKKAIKTPNKKIINKVINKQVKNLKAMKGKETMQKIVKRSEKKEKEVLSQKEIIDKSIRTVALPVPKKVAKKETAKKENKKSKATVIDRPIAKNETPEVLTIIGKSGLDDADDALRISIENKTKALFKLQLIDSQIDKIRIVCGELPLEVQDLEDSMEGLLTRIENYKKDIVALDVDIKAKNQAIKDAQSLIKKYEDQKNKVRNNREYDSLTKEIEYQTLEIQLCEKKITEFKYLLEVKKEAVALANEELEDLKTDLDLKKQELKEITSETEKEEKELIKKSQDLQKHIEERLLTAYMRIRENAQNGLAVVKVERDACGGCFNKIPPQRQLDIRLHKKVIVCEYCGRIMIDDIIADALMK